jgi:sugar phosphate isomerase/epimerase
MTRYSLAQLTAVHASPPELIRIASAAGYDHVGLRLLEVTGGDAWPLASDPQLLRETRAAMSDSGVGILDVELVRLTADFDLESIKATIEVAAELGVRHILTQAHDSDWARLVHNFGSLCDLLARHSLTADIEFLTWTDMRDVRNVVRLLEAANRPNVGITVDSLHFYRSGCELEDLKDVPPELFHFMQISDAPATGPASLEGLIFAARENRFDPGAGELDLRALLLALPADIAIAIEIPNSRLAAKMSDEERARNALAATRTLVEQVRSARSPAAGEFS